jgi:hypothetical protein
MTATVAVIIPSYNAADTLGGVATGVRSVVPTAQIIAVNDGSVDATASVARDHCDLVIDFPQNRGKGAALCAAFGTRTRAGTSMPLRRRFGNWLSSTTVTVLAGVRLEDTQSGYRAIRRSVLERVSARGDRYEFETDFLIQAARAGFRITHVPIPTIYGSASHFRTIADTLRVARTIWRYGVLSR